MDDILNRKFQVEQRDILLQERIVDDLSAFFSTLGLVLRGTLESPITGAKGNREYFIYLTYP